MTVVVLAGGTGGAKLARGMLDVVGDELIVIANTGDDTEFYGSYVSADPDLVTFWLADMIDQRGWGLTGDTFAVMQAMRSLGEDVWFHLGDRDLALCLARARRLAAGERLTSICIDICRSLGVDATVLPASDDSIRTWVQVDGKLLPFQDFMIRRQARGQVEAVEFRGVDVAVATDETLAALTEARAVIIGPSNPAISIGPILALPGIRDLLRSRTVIAVSPLVAGRAIKGPTEAFMRWAGQPLDSVGVASFYDGLIDGIVADERHPDLPTLHTDVSMPNSIARERLARFALDFALALGSDRT